MCHLADKSHCWPSGPDEVSVALKNSLHKCIKDSETYTRLTNLHKSHTMPVAVIQYDGLNYRGRIILKCWSVLYAGQGPEELIAVQIVLFPCHCHFRPFYFSFLKMFFCGGLKLPKCNIVMFSFVNN